MREDFPYPNNRVLPDSTNAASAPLRHMTFPCRVLTLVAYAAFAQLPALGLGTVCAMDETGMVAATNHAQSRAPAPVTNENRMADGMLMPGTSDGEPLPCDERMPPGECQIMPGCIVGASMAAAMFHRVTPSPAITGLGAAPVTAPISRATAPEVPPPRA